MRELNENIVTTHSKLDVNTLRSQWELGGNTLGTSKFKTSKSMLGNCFDFSKNHWFWVFKKN